MTSHRSHHWSHAALVAAAVTGLAALTAWVLAAVVHLAEPAVVLSVMVTAFATSWNITFHRPGSHRVALVPAHSRTR
ncbi:unannotated protein [freshwater metagenome]|uniref:Unannotated protein n=1 Tax=freshwater metagenome TaxID=449393 RepID=A0A6J7F7R9_9ZZZZ|nr:hypothetical protein [Actinomycetota bacterium]